MQKFGDARAFAAAMTQAAAFTCEFSRNQDFVTTFNLASAEVCQPAHDSSWRLQYVLLLHQSCFATPCRAWLIEQHRFHGAGGTILHQEGGLADDAADKSVAEEG